MFHRLAIPTRLACLVATIPLPLPQPATALESTPFNPRNTPTPTRFESLSPTTTGLDFTNPIDLAHPDKHLYASSMATGGVTVADFDADGLPDIFLTSGLAPNALFHQTARWQFADTTSTAGLAGGDAWAVGAVAFDADNDADIDLLVANYLSPCQLYLNDGNANFTPATRSGLEITDASHTPTVCDFDRDGDLDVYLLTNRCYRPGGIGFPQEQTIEITPTGPRILPRWEKFYDAVQTGDTDWEAQVVGRPDRLFQNNGDGTFTDVSKSAGINHRGHGLSATWFDWDGDGHTDLWVANDFDDPDRLYHNNGDGTFTDVAKSTVPYTTWFSMGADFGDVDGDALPDFFVADMQGSTHYKQKTAMGSMGDKTWFMKNADPPQVMRNALFLNAGNGRFTETAFLAGVARTNWTWAVRLADLDLDGLNDIYIQAGMSRNFNEKDDPRALKPDPTRSQWDRYEHLPPLKEPSWAFRNPGTFPMQETSAAWGLDHTGMAYGAALADLDRDGDLDIISVRLDEPVALLRNNTTDNHSIAFRLTAGSGNRHGTGATFTLSAGGKTQVRTTTPVRGYLGCDEPIAHFGLGDATAVGSLTVLWPDGYTQTLTNLPSGYLHTVDRADGNPNKPTPIKPEPLFTPSAHLAHLTHHESPFDDFLREPLLPNTMSRWGPGHAWGDIDNDGDPDLYLGSGSGGRRHVVRNHNGTFTPQNDDALIGDLFCEDMAALFLDADNDGDLDLFVVSGGVEHDPGSSYYQDRLYLNDGSGHFTTAPAGSVPSGTDAGGPAAAADFDRDGDLDLFIGGRSVPGAYPLPGKSHLLLNDGHGKFTDATAQLAPGLAEVGMVTAALWSDADNDGLLDLLLTLEWGTPKYFKNTGTTLADHSTTAGLDHLHGWWNAIAGRDLDADGDIDYVVTNFGHNTKYHASPEHPALIYYGDMDGTGKPHIIEAEFEHGSLFPVRGRSCSSGAMPFIKNKFSTYHDFALASLSDIYSPKTLESATRYQATTLASGILRNDGHAKFSFDPLPWQAQVAPSLGITITEINADPYPDIIIAQNFYHPQIETGRMSGGLGLLLTGNPSGQPTPVPARKSGISIPQDARGISALDLDGDNLEDLVVTTNAGAPRTFTRSFHPPQRPPRLITVKLPHDQPGTRVTLTATGSPPQTAETQLGSGYLSAPPSTLTFYLPADTTATLSATFPDGSSTTRSLTPADHFTPLGLAHP